MRPIPGATPQLRAEAAWLAHTYAVFARTPPSAGITPVEALEYLDAPSPAYLAVAEGTDPAYAATSNFRVLANADLPAGARLGLRYDSFCVNTPVYLATLLRRFEARGGVIRRATLGGVREARGLAARVVCVVNASGAGFEDPRCFVTRGQTVLVRNECARTVTRQAEDGSWAFVIPRFGGAGTIVGGTKEVGDLRVDACMETRARLLAKAQALWPEMVRGVGWDVVRDVVGYRPSREGGMRVEVEWVGGAEGWAVVHAYGAGGRGFEVSWGVADEVARLVEGVVGGGGGVAKL